MPQKETPPKGSVARNNRALLAVRTVVASDSTLGGQCPVCDAFGSRWLLRVEIPDQRIPYGDHKRLMCMPCGARLFRELGRALRG